MSRERRKQSGLELLGIALLSTAVGLGAIVWVATGVGAVLSGRGWPHVTMTTLARALAALPSHLGNPPLAWPARMRARVPGVIAFYAGLTLTSLLTAAGVAGGLWLRSNGPDGAGSRGARWAGGGELAALRRRHRVPGRRGGGGGTGRLALGFRGRTLLRAEAKHALVVFGPPQSGKSAGIAIPALLEWQGPAVASSIKTDLLGASLRRRAALGDVMVFDPYGLSEIRAATWSPLRLARTWDGALSTAMRLSAAAELDTATVKGGNYWLAAAEQRLAPLLWAAAQTDAGIAAVVRWGYGQGDAELPPILHRLLDAARPGNALADAQAAYDAHVAFEALAGETRSSIESTVQMLLRAYRSPQVQTSAASCEITPERLLSGEHTLYLIGDSHRSRLLRPIFLALLQELIDHAFGDATARGGRLARPLLLCLDELGNVAPLPNLAEIASTAPSHNIQLVSIFHDIAQARGRYGNQVQTVINSHRARMLLPGVADLETLRYFSDLLGERIDVNPGSGAAASGARRDLRMPERRPLAAPQELRQLREREALLIYGRLVPTKLRLRTYFDNRRLTRLARGEGGGSRGEPRSVAVPAEDGLGAQVDSDWSALVRRLRRHGS
jgi:type IV secretion system protein VirD4